MTPTPDSNADENSTEISADSGLSGSKASDENNDELLVEEGTNNSTTALPLPSLPDDSTSRHSSSGTTTYPYAGTANASSTSDNTTTTNDDDDINDDNSSEGKCTLGLRLDDVPSASGGAQPGSADTDVSGLTNQSDLEVEEKEKKKGTFAELSSKAVGEGSKLYPLAEHPEIIERLNEAGLSDVAQNACDENENSEEILVQLLLHLTSQEAASSRPSQSTPVSRPGAYAVYHPPDTMAEVERATAVSRRPSATNSIMTATTSTAPDHLNITEAYTVDDTPPPSATVVKTFYGVERKRCYQIAGGSLVILAVVLAIAIPLSRKSAETKTCGPLCGEGNGEVPNPDLIVLGQTCRQYDEDSTNVVAPADSCSSTYSVAAYGCGCPSSLETAESSSVCGKLCSDGSAVPAPELEVSDYKLNSYTCRDWETLSLFESNPDECPLYNAIGHLCGCTSNEPHPDSCGSLCEDGEALSTGVELDNWGYFQVWGVTCSNWNTFSSFLPSWYNNDEGETCGDFYESIAYGCACPGTRSFPMGECGPLCQELRTCKPLCEDGSALPEESKDVLIKHSSCENWEYTARFEVHEFICPQYNQFGAMCGCDNTPHPKSWSKKCGNFCSERPENLPYPDMVILEKTCETWYYEANYLPFTHSDQTEEKLSSFGSCDNLESIAYECGCEAPNPPEKSCGKLCRDGSDVPEPNKEVGGRTCRDWDYLSVWDERLEICEARYHGVSDVCGCTQSSPTPPCFEIEQLNNRTWFYDDEKDKNIFQYTITFGEGGQFRQLEQVPNQVENQRFLVIGYARDDEEYPNNATAEIMFNGGHFCGEHGARQGTVQFVEVENATRPEIGTISEPAICRYMATMNVPPFCRSNELS